MTQKIKRLQPEKFYYIYNQGNNNETIFFDSGSYQFFLRQFDKYITPIADLYAYSLLPNEFHLLIYTKSVKDILFDEFKYTTVKKARALSASHQFSHFFNSFTQSTNNKFDRKGCLFNKPFKRIEVINPNQIIDLIVFIHQLPEIRNSKNFQDYLWSSYQWSFQENIKFPNRFHKLFNGVKNYKQKHSILVNTIRLKTETTIYE